MVAYMNSESLKTTLEPESTFLESVPTEILDEG